MNKVQIAVGNSCALCLAICVLWLSPAMAQTVTGTVSLPGTPVAVAVNPVTNDIYVANNTYGHSCIPDPQRCYVLVSTHGTAITGSGSTSTPWTSKPQSFPQVGGQPQAPGSVAVNAVTNQVYVASAGLGLVEQIDGATNAPSAVNASSIWATAVNPVTNKLYAAYNTNISGVFGTQYGFSVIDGTTSAVTTVVDSHAINPVAIDVNPVTNKIYIANNGSANVTVIDGATNRFSDVSAGSSPIAVAVNPITNKIYAVNNTSSGTVAVIDGATGATTSVAVGASPVALGLNPVTNKIYVANSGSNNITVIDGATNATITLSDSTASQPASIAVDALTNQIYVANSGSATVTVIDGATSSLTTVTNPNGGSSQVALDPVSDTVYAVNVGSDTITVIAGVAGSGAPDFAMGATSGSLTLSNGNQATTTIVVGPPYGSAINLSCAVSGPAPVPGCELSATSVTPGPTYGTATLTITAPAVFALQSPSNVLRFGKLPYAAWFPLAFGIFLVGGSKKRRVPWLPAGTLMLLALSLVACGGGNVSSGSSPKNYTVTVTGTSGAIQHSAQVTVTVP